MSRRLSRLIILAAVFLAGCASHHEAGPVARSSIDGEPILCSPVPGWLAAALDLGLAPGAEDLEPSIREGRDHEQLAKADQDLRYLSASESGGVWYVSGHVRGPGFGAVDAIGTWAVGSLGVLGPIHSAEGIAYAVSRFGYGPLAEPGLPDFDAEGVQNSRDCSKWERKLRGRSTLLLPNIRINPYTDGGKSLRDVASARAMSGASTAIDTFITVRPALEKARGVNIISGVMAIHESSKTTTRNPAVMPA